MISDIGTYIFVGCTALVLLWRVKRGIKNGFLKETANIVSLAISVVCLIIVFFLLSSIKAKTYGTLTVCIIALVVIGIAFKISSLIVKPIFGITKSQVIGGIDKFLGAVMGIAETAIVAALAYYLLNKW